MGILELITTQKSSLWRKKIDFKPKMSSNQDKNSNHDKNSNQAKKYGLNTTSGGRYSLYATNNLVDVANQSEDSLTKRYIENIRNRIVPAVRPDPDDSSGDFEEGEILIKSVSELSLTEATIEKVIVNCEERAKRTFEAIVDPNHQRFLQDASQCMDGDRVTTTKLNFTNSYNLQINNQ